MKIALVIPCVNSKYIETPKELQYRNVISKDIRKAYNTFNKRLDKSKAPINPTIEVYSGDAHKVAATIPNVNKYIMSCAYGLIPSDKKIKSYSITYSEASLDTVRKASFDNISTSKANEAWSRLLIEDGKIDIQKLIDTNDIVYIVVSETYITSMKDYISSLDAKKIIIVSPDTKPTDDWKHYFLPCGMRMAKVTGGNKFSIGTCVAKWLIENHRNKNKASIMKVSQNLLDSIPYVKKVFKYKDTVTDEKAIMHIKAMNMGYDNMSSIKTKFNNRNIGIGDRRLTDILTNLKNNS